MQKKDMNAFSPKEKAGKEKESKQDQHTILVVDDEPLVRWSLKSALEKAGLGVVVAESAEAAIDLIQSSAFDLIITDMNLPQKDGFEVAKVGQCHSNHIPIIMITAYGDAQSRKKASSLGIKNLIDKPFDLAEIVGLVWHLVGGRG